MTLRTWWLRTWPGRVFLAAIIVFLVGFGWVFGNLVGSVPNREELRAFTAMPTANILFDAADREVFTIAKEHRIEVPLSQVAPILLKAVVAIEDRRFYEHDGFDPIRIAGSALAVLEAGEAVQGGSTITQQLADRKSTRLNSSHSQISYAVFC